MTNEAINEAINKNETKFNTYVETLPENIQSQALGNISNPNPLGSEGNSAPPISHGGFGAR